MSAMQISIGPILFLWEKDEVERFYQAVAQSDADIVYLGETVCGKRRLSKWQDYIGWARMLNESGKQVVLSSLALLESTSQLNDLRRLCDNGEFLVEVNDIGAVTLLSEKSLPFVIGPAINVYNGQALAKLARLGAIRWTMPVELGCDWLRNLKDEYNSLTSNAMQFEVFSYGLLPLAYSARCFTARHHNRPKDECELICRQYKSGKELYSQESKLLFVLNGIQTMSGQVYNLIDDRQMLASLADIARISAQDIEDLKWINAFKGASPATRPQQHVNGYWHHLSGAWTTG